MDVARASFYPLKIPLKDGIGSIACVAGGMRDRASAIFPRGFHPRVKFSSATFRMVFGCRPLLSLLINQLNKPIREQIAVT